MCMHGFLRVRTYRNPRTAGPHGIQIGGKLENGSPIFFPALPAFSSVASFFQRCQLFPPLPAFSSVASFFQRCQLFPALPAFSSVARFFCMPPFPPRTCDPAHLG